MGIDTVVEGLCKDSVQGVSRTNELFPLSSRCQVCYCLDWSCLSFSSFFLYSYSLVEKIGNEQSKLCYMLLNEVQKVIAMRSDIDSGVDNINNCLCYFIMVILTSFPALPNLYTLYS